MDSQPLRNSEPFNGIIRFVFYKDHSGGMVLGGIGGRYPETGRPVRRVLKNLDKDHDVSELKLWLYV